MEPRDSIRGGRRRAITRGGTALWLLAALTIVALADPAWAGGAIYSFIDDRGVTHFTNLPPRDKRYRPVPGLAKKATAMHRAPVVRTYDPLITEAAAIQGVPPALVKAVIAAESGFDCRAVSRRGAQGLMQLMPATSASLGVLDPFEPADNVRGGTSYLRAMIDRYGDLASALAAYNAGPGAVDRYGGIPPYQETRAYVDRVLTYYRRYHGDFH